MNVATEKKRENVKVLLNEVGHLMMNYSKSFNICAINESLTSTFARSNEFKGKSSKKVQ